MFDSKVIRALDFKKKSIIQFLFDCRVEKVLLEIQRRSPFMTDAEIKMGKQLRSLESKLETMRQSMESLRRREELYDAKKVICI